MATIRALSRTSTDRVLTWVPVTDAEGRTHMEMHWHVGVPAPRIRRTPAA